MKLFVVACAALSAFGLVQAFDHYPFPCHESYTGIRCSLIVAQLNTKCSYYSS